MIDQFIKTHSLPSYRLNQYNDAIYKRFISSFDELTTWPADLRNLAKVECTISVIEQIRVLESSGKDTVKVLFRRKSDGKLFESVLMRHTDGRNTVCVSCMVGCPVGCLFCATGKLGFLGNLTYREIADQVLYFARLVKRENQKISNIVFMGMGEPLLNLSHVMEAIRIFTDPDKMALSERRITISTSGITPQLHNLVTSGYKGRIALSLHAPTQALRSKLMPIASKYPLEGILGELSYHAKKTNKRISYEYILVDGINDSPDQARQLVRLLGTTLTHINLIPCNPVEGVPYKRSTEQSIRKFIRILDASHMHYTIRVTMGDSIRAACGQLANAMQ